MSDHQNQVVKIEESIKHNKTADFDPENDNIGQSEIYKNIFKKKTNNANLKSKIIKNMVDDSQMLKTFDNNGNKNDLSVFRKRKKSPIMSNQNENLFAANITNYTEKNYGIKENHLLSRNVKYITGNFSKESFKSFENIRKRNKSTGSGSKKQAERNNSNTKKSAAKLGFDNKNKSFIVNDKTFTQNKKIKLTHDNLIMNSKFLNTTLSKIRGCSKESKGKSKSKSKSKSISRDKFGSNNLLLKNNKSIIMRKEKENNINYSNQIQPIKNIKKTGNVSKEKSSNNVQAGILSQGYKIPGKNLNFEKRGKSMLEEEALKVFQEKVNHEDKKLLSFYSKKRQNFTNIYTAQCNILEEHEQDKNTDLYCKKMENISALFTKYIKEFENEMHTQIFTKDVKEKTKLESIRDEIQVVSVKIIGFFEFYSKVNIETFTYTKKLISSSQLILEEFIKNNRNPLLDNFPDFFDSDTQQDKSIVDAITLLKKYTDFQMGENKMLTNYIRDNLEVSKIKEMVRTNQQNKSHLSPNGNNFSLFTGHDSIKNKGSSTCDHDTNVNTNTNITAIFEQNQTQDYLGNLDKYNSPSGNDLKILGIKTDDSLLFNNSSNYNVSLSKLIDPCNKNNSMQTNQDFLTGNFESRKKSQTSDTDKRNYNSGISLENSQGKKIVNLNKDYELKSGASFSKLNSYQDENVKKNVKEIFENSKKSYSKTLKSTGTEDSPSKVNVFDLRRQSDKEPRSTIQESESSKFQFENRRKSSRDPVSSSKNIFRAKDLNQNFQNDKEEMRKKLRLNLPSEKPLEGFHDEFMKNWDQFSLSWRMKMLDDKTFHMYNPNQTKLD